MEEDMELEEGEAYSYDNNNSNGGNAGDKVDGCIDPDVAFSYMDVKIRDVLGHFQKEFEGGVSAENLGAKFGGYGSFLPAYQRSAALPQSRPSPAPSPLEGPRNNGVSVAASNAKSSITAISRSKQRSIDSSKQEKSMPPLKTVEDENSNESANRKSISSVPDQKRLKVRIKLGKSDTLPRPNKAAIYSGLGLDASPSSSFDGTASESEGISHGPTAMDLESPSRIFQIMISCPLNGDPLLSPLPDLTHFCEKKRQLEDKKCEKLLEKKIPKSDQKNNVPTEPKASSSKKSKNKELDVELLACDDLISKTLALPIISGAEDLSRSMRKVSEEGGIREPEGNPLVSKEKNISKAEGSSSKGKKKLKGTQNQGVQVADIAKESLSGSSSVTKSEKSRREDISRTVSKYGESKSKKVPEKGEDIYKDFFGEFEQEEENRAGSLGSDLGNGQHLRKDRLDLRKIRLDLSMETGPVENNTKLKDRESDDAFTKAPTSQLHVDAALGVAQSTSVAPFVIKENWVCCDKCERWRLLPIDKDPNSLPKKWLCSMLDWLPGKNHCGVSEAETNTILSQSYALSPTSQSNTALNSEKPALAFADTVGKSDENRPTRTPEAPSTGGKKKQSMKQIIHSKTAGDPSDSEQATKSKQRAYERHSDEGETDIWRSSKKLGNRGSQSTDEDRRSVGRSAGKNIGKSGSSDDRARTSKLDSADEVWTKQKRESLENGNFDTASGKSSLKKRNRKVHGEVVTRDKDEHRKEKKARVSKNDRQESNVRCGSDVRPSVGPTSIPYKADKSKHSFQQVKGSPAESFSSSPMRRNASDGERKERNRSSEYGREGDERKASHGEVKPRNGERNERKRAEHDNTSVEKNDPIGKTRMEVEKSSRRGSGDDRIGGETRTKKSKALPPSGKLDSGPVKVDTALEPSEKVITVKGTRDVSDRRDSFTQAAANAIKEAKDLKHMADRVKASGSNLEGTGLYFQAALKFLHGASLLESSFNASSKYPEMIQSLQTYSSTAKLFEFCAQEYEKCKDMASAALAYKCMEVVYMKVVYLSQNTASRDRQELQSALKLVPLGESPSSSASDVDHVNNTTAIDMKASLPKDVNHPPQAAGNQIVTAQNRPNFERLLNFVHDINSAMEASRRSMAAFNAAGSESGDSRHTEIISSIKRAIDFNFQDIEGLLQLVRIATEAISR